ncbi:MAG TPA: SLBB domain-containing protein [Ignavibacteriaceae bacterium]|nr:SLBB domain-containing protein [Ignavibacteriaceae bacterium]
MTSIRNILILSIFFVLNLFGQEEMQIGTSLGQFRQSQGGYYDYSDPESVNLKVSVWGFVKFPGKYIVPIYTNAFDLLSYAGGPDEDANLDDIRIFRINEDSSQSFIDLDYKDFLWNKELTSIKEAPRIVSGDILLVPGEERLYFRDYFTLTLSILSVLISLVILIININNN